MKIADKTILITGAGGLLGRRLLERFSGKCSLCAHFHSEPKDAGKAKVIIGDLTDMDDVKALAERVKPDIIVNSAALADVDRCEFEPELSRRVNVHAVKLLVKQFPQAKIVHISTDYVFDSDSPGKPKDERNPANTYGLHKVESEKIVVDTSQNNLIVRVNTLFDNSTRKNFFPFILSTLKAGETIQGISDQTSNPISSISAARMIFELVTKNAKGIYHLGGGDFVSRFEFAVQAAEYFGLDATLIEPVESDTFEHRARRPLTAGLDCQKTESFLGYKMPSLADEFAVVKRAMGV